MSTTPKPKQNNPSNDDRFSKYEQSWNITFKDCFLAWLKSEKVPIRRFMLILFICLLAGISVLAWLSAPPQAYWIASFTFIVTLATSLYLQHFEKG
ncbi:MAG: hypothetical protein WAW39_28500 [Prosthecobacter sp.]|uniref:hypothetical protein n=1 Tax=Prosthecobacter sp. TaxID=1965333 RepID=UPI003BAE49E5